MRGSSRRGTPSGSRGGGSRAAGRTHARPSSGADSGGACGGPEWDKKHAARKRFRGDAAGGSGHLEEAVAGLGISELRELRQPREENVKLKRPVTDLSRDGTPLGPAKKVLRPRDLRVLARWVGQVYCISDRRSAKLIGMAARGLLYAGHKGGQVGYEARLRGVRLGLPLAALLRRQRGR